MRCFNPFPGGHSGVVPPDPIPNSEVKRACADGSVALPCKSRSPPGALSKEGLPARGGLRLCAVPKGQRSPIAGCNRSRQGFIPKTSTPHGGGFFIGELLPRSPSAVRSRSPPRAVCRNSLTVDGGVWPGRSLAITATGAPPGPCGSGLSGSLTGGDTGFVALGRPSPSMPQIDSAQEWRVSVSCDCRLGAGEGDDGGA